MLEASSGAKLSKFPAGFREGRSVYGVQESKEERERVSEENQEAGCFKKPGRGRGGINNGLRGGRRET